MAIDFDVQGARKAGYSDDEIAAELSKAAGFDKDAAEKAGHSPTDIINEIMPQAATQKKLADTGAKAVELFGRDPSKAGKLTLGDYATRAGAGAVTGGAIGLGIGAITGPGAIVTGTTGAIMGAASGAIEAFVEDLGFGEGTQAVAGMVVPGGGLATKVGQYVESKIAAKALEYAAKKTTGIPLAGPLVRAFQSSKPVDVKAIEKITGIKGATAEANLSGEQANVVKQKIASEFEQGTGTKIPEGVDPEDHIYNLTSSEINKANKSIKEIPAVSPIKGITEGTGWGGAETITKEGAAAIPAQKQGFVNSSFFKRAASLEGEVSTAQVDKYKKLFEDGKGNNLPGQDIINNIRNFKYGKDLEKGDFKARDKRWDEGVKLEKEFNGWLQQQPSNTAKRPWQADARKAYEQVSVASARDKLPGLMESVVSSESKAELRSAAGDLQDQMWNLSKSPEGQKQFWEQLTGNLKNIPAKDTKVLWQEIGPTVQKRFLSNPEQFNKLDEVMRNVKTPQDLSRAIRVIMSVSSGAAIAKEKNL
jgi:hypothetical protein